MKNMLIILLLTIACAQAEKCPSCMDDARKAQDAYDMILPSAAIGLGSALLLAGTSHLLGYDKKIDDGWFIALPLMFVTYQLGSGVYHSYRVGVGLSSGF